MSRLIVTAALIILVYSHVCIAADPKNVKGKDNRQELERINKQLKDTQRKVDSLKHLEGELESTISGYHERVDRNRKIVTKVESQLTIVRQRLTENTELMETSEERLKKLRSGYVSFLVDYYHRQRARSGTSWAAYESILAEERMTRYLARVSGRSTREMVSATDSIRRYAQSLDSLEQTGLILDRERQDKKAKINLDLTLKRREEASLGSVHRQTGILEERVASLSEAARQMENIIAQLEKKQKERADKNKSAARYATGSFDKLQGSLPPPIKGRVVSSFGWKTDPNTTLKSFAPGIDILPAKGQNQVMAAASGRVAYIGALRGYDNFVILEHDDGYYSTYAGLSKITVEVNELVETGRKLGICGNGPVHFEIRHEREHLDPAAWLNNDEF